MVDFINTFKITVIFNKKINYTHYIFQLLDIFMDGFIICFLTPIRCISCLQDELDKVAAVWNQHLIRPSPNVRVPSGRPNVMFNFPALYGTDDYAEPVAQPVIDACRDECIFRSSVPCDVDIYDISCSIMAQEHIDIPVCADTARETYLHLRDMINAMLQ